MVHKSLLPNGTTVLFCPLRETEAVTVLVLVKVGSRYETKEVVGVSHFIEHMMFKGTRRRPSSLALTKELDSVGAEFNAYTSKDHTGYYVKAVKEQLPLALDILSDMLHHSLFKGDELDRERGVIIEEIKMYEDNPLMSLGDVFEGSMYGDHPLGWHIAGTIPMMKSLSREEVMRYLHAQYHPDRTLVVVAGNYAPSVRRLVRKYFGRRGECGAVHEYRQAPEKIREGVFIKEKDTKQVHLGFGTRGYPLGHPDAEAATLLSIIMGGTMSSRLFISVRERKGLCYYIRAGLNAYEDTGNFGIFAGVDLKRVELALKTIISELQSARRKGFTREELRRAKEYIRGKVTLDLEDSESIAEWYGKQYFFLKELQTPHEKLERYLKVTMDDIKRVAKQLLDHRRYTLALIGPLKDAKPFTKIIKA
ncbi:MAG: pitrilysin family protein [Patescibacteria group bacterium]